MGGKLSVSRRLLALAPVPALRRRHASSRSGPPVCALPFFVFSSPPVGVRRETQCVEQPRLTLAVPSSSAAATGLRAFVPLRDAAPSSQLDALALSVHERWRTMPSTRGSSFPSCAACSTRWDGSLALAAASPSSTSESSAARRGKKGLMNGQKGRGQRRNEGRGMKRRRRRVKENEGCL